MSASMKKSFGKKMANMEAAGLFKHEVACPSGDITKTIIGENHDIINFITHDFLAWKQNSDIQKSIEQAFSTYGIGNTSSRNAMGTMVHYQHLESQLSSFLNVEDCLLFPSSYLANIGTIDAITDYADSIFVDELTSPALTDAIRLSRANVSSYTHRDFNHLEYQLKCSKNSRFRIIANDSIYYADGEYIASSRINTLKKDYDAIALIDESWSLGLVGDKGKGISNLMNSVDKPELITGTLNYGLGNVPGSFVCGDKILIDWIRQTSRAYLLAEPISPISVAVVSKVLEILESDAKPLEQLRHNTHYLKQRIQDKGWNLIHNEHPMISVIIGNTLKVQKIVEQLYQQKILVSGLCYPNTSEDAARIRIHISASHSQEQMNQLIDALSHAMHHLEHR